MTLRAAREGPHAASATMTRGWARRSFFALVLLALALALAAAGTSAAVDAERRCVPKAPKTPHTAR